MKDSPYCEEALVTADEKQKVMNRNKLNRSFDWNFHFKKAFDQNFLPQNFQFLFYVYVDHATRNHASTKL